MTSLKQLRENSQEISLELYADLAERVPGVLAPRRLEVLDTGQMLPLVRQQYLDDMERSTSESRGRVIRWVKLNRRRLGGLYSMGRLEWLEDFHEAVAHTGGRVPNALAGMPWLGWYIAIRGNPFEDFPVDLSWWCALHRLFLIRAG